ncbi:MAG: HNH endonuclease [Thaumarchaeota archaeon]|nr:HNH endonuclease [Nitrososphaerota archaeon]
MGYSDDLLDYVYDKNNGYCWWCGKKLAFTNYGVHGAKGAWEIDHSNPVSRGGTDYLGNLVPSCIECNRSKGDRRWR